MVVALGTATSRRRRSTAVTTTRSSSGKRRKRFRRAPASRHPMPQPRNAASRMKLEKYERSRMYAGIHRMSAISRKSTRNDERNRVTDESFGCARHRPTNHEVGRRRLADVRDVVHLVRRLEDDAARPDAARRAALKRVERTLFDDQQLFVLMLVRRMRRLSRIERRDVNLELVERRRRRPHDLTHSAPVVRLCVTRRPLVHRGLLNVFLRDEGRERAQYRDRDHGSAAL